jgi:hypothetical protein
MLLQSGGLKKKAPKTGLVPVRDMINSPGASLEMFTCGSLKGFMFVLNVRPEHSEYFGLNSNHRFTTPVTSFILKLAVTSAAEESLDDYNDVTKLQTDPDHVVGKATETKTSFFEEAKLQQSIWKNSIRGARQETCPSVANLSFFKNADALRFLDFMMYKVHTTGSLHTVDYLKGVCAGNAGYGLGLILMPKIERSDTFHSFKHIPKGNAFHGVAITETIVNNMYAKLIAKIIRLYIEGGVIHFDLHGKNALIYVTERRELDVIIIDFGRASNLRNGTNDEYLNVNEKKIMLDNAMSQENRGSSEGGYYAKCVNMCVTGTSDNNKIEFIRGIISMIAKNDHDKNQNIFKGDEYSHGNYQMSWIEAIFPIYTQMVPRSNDRKHDPIALLAFHHLCTIIIPSPGDENRLSEPFINEHCENFERRNSDDFIVTFTTTWGEWGKSFGPYIYRGVSGLVPRRSKGGRKIKPRTRKYKQSKNRKSKNRKSKNRK